jgi:hypothetical protein
MTIEELHKYRIGKNKNIKVFEQDIGNVVYGADIDGTETIIQPENGNVPFFKVSNMDLWLKMFLVE